ncbi:MAG TPA: squalene--hopene cyclase [Acidimicrobiales bacterium]|nr:squalene--hopene cyclase [Acidimicrobiales bacterium]
MTTTAAEPLAGAPAGAAPDVSAETPPGPAAATPAAPTPAACLDRAVAALLDLQDPAGWWKGELETNVTMDAEDLLLRQFLGILTDEDRAGAARWIRSQQREDGTWANYYGGPGDLSTTAEAWVALRLAGDPADADHMRRAAAFVREQGGLERSRVFTRIWLALFGKWSWDDLPVLPPELIFFPKWMPLNIYDFGCWARQTVVALTVVGAHRPVRHLPVEVDELRSGAAPLPGHPATTWAGVFERLDRALHVYERRPVRWLRRLALRQAERWIVERQEADGCWGGIQPPWVYSLMALNVQGYSLDHPVMRAGIEGLDGFTVEDEKGRRIEACQSPVWDTCLAVTALADAGVPADHPAVARAAEWLVGEEVTVAGDWQVRRPDLAPGGWAFEFANDHYPDVDDTAEVVLALHRVLGDRADGGAPGVGGGSGHEAVGRGLDWVLGMQCADGGWAAFDVDNVRTLCESLPFCDFGELIDPPSADVTAHVVEMLAAVGRTGRPLERGLDWLLAHQEPDGSWFGRWGANYVYGTGAVVPALVAGGLPAGHPAVRRAVAWLEAHQNPDGGWGEDLRSYDDPTRRGRGPSTASQTAWALLALLAADNGSSRPAAAGEGTPATEPGGVRRGPVKSGPVEKGIAWLMDTQRPDGTWDEPWFTGTGFPGDFYINYHLYRMVFPVSALGRYVRGGGPGHG